MLASLTLIAAYAITIAAPGTAEEGCPSPRQVTEALQARLAGVMLPPGQAAGPTTLRVAVTSPAGGAVHVDVVDGMGETVLRRALPPPPRGHAADCPALAETVALIVDRYLHDIGYEAPPSPAPPPAATTHAPAPAAGAAPSMARPTSVWQIGLGAEGRLGDSGNLDSAATLTVGVELPWRTRRLGIQLGGGMAPPATAQWPDHRASLYRIPLRLSLYLGLPAGAGQFEAGLGGGADGLLVSVSGPDASRRLHPAPFAEAALGYALPVARHVYVRATARGGVGTPFAFVTTTGGPEVTSWSTPRTYLDLGLQSGVSFP